jgi:hypothetical protein
MTQELFRRFQSETIAMSNHLNCAMGKHFCFYRRMSWLFCFIWAFLISSSALAEEAPGNRGKARVWFVATNGNDGWSGTLPAPTETKDDGPLRTVQEAIRKTALPNASSNSAPMIFIRRGLHILDHPIVLSPTNSGLTILSYPGEHPVISGGRRITNWSEAPLRGMKLWRASFALANGMDHIFRELWVNGHRATRARHPNHGYLAIENLPDATPSWEQGQTRFRYKPGDLQKWASLTNAEVVAMTRWVESRLPIKEIDEKERIISFGKKSVFQLAAGDPYYVEGALELIDQPGEWYYDPASASVYYFPLAGEKMSDGEIIAPALTQVLRFEGNPEASNFVQNVTVRGLEFSHTEWYFPEGFQSGTNRLGISPKPSPEVGGFGQAAVGVPGAIWGQGMRRCLIEDCAIHHLGTYAIELWRGCQSNRISYCNLDDLGAGGIKLGEGGISEKPAEQTFGNEITDCRIENGGKLFHSAVGVWIGQTFNNTFSHNLVHDFYYTGISVGWTWGYGPSIATNNLISFNDVHHIGDTSDGAGPILSDMAGIYTLGREPGTRIVNNSWHDIGAIHYGGWGIYFDEGSSGLVAISNVVYRTTHGGFHQHYGETNVVRNNIFAFGRDQQIQRTRPEAHSSFSFQTNLVYFDSGALLSGDWAGEHYLIDGNIYFDLRSPKAEGGYALGPANWDDWRKRGHDTNSVFVDPRFRDAKANDFQLFAESPALAWGFLPIDLNGVGPRPKTEQRPSRP